MPTADLTSPIRFALWDLLLAPRADLRRLQAFQSVITVAHGCSTPAAQILQIQDSVQELRIVVSPWQRPLALLATGKRLERLALGGSDGPLTRAMPTFRTFFERGPSLVTH